MENIKRGRRLNLPMRATVWSVISGLISRGAGVVGTPIFTRLLNPEEFGLYPLYVTWLAVVNSVLVTGITGSAIYRGLQRHKGQEELFVSSTLGLIFTVAIPIFALCALIRNRISEVTGLGSGVLFLLLSEALLGAVVAVRGAKYRYEYNYRALAAVNMLSAIGSPIISVIILSVTPYRAEARIFGSFLMTLVIAAPSFITSFHRGGRLYNREVWGYLARVNLPLIPHYVSTALILRVGELVIGRVHGEGAIGKYSVAMSVGLWLTSMTNALIQVFSPWIMRKVARGDYAKIRELVFVAFSLVMLAALFLLCFAPEVITVMTPPEYRDALPAVYPLALSVGLMFLSNATLAGEVYFERSFTTSLPTVLTAIIQSAAAVFILPLSDYRLSALFTFISYLVLFLLSSSTFRHLSGEKMVKIKETLLVILTAAIYGALLFLLRGVFISRALLAIPLIPPLILLGKKVITEAREPK